MDSNVFKSDQMNSYLFKSVHIYCLVACKFLLAKQVNMVLLAQTLLRVGPNRPAVLAFLQCWCSCSVGHNCPAVLTLTILPCLP